MPISSKDCRSCSKVPSSAACVVGGTPDALGGSGAVIREVEVGRARRGRSASQAPAFEARSSRSRLARGSLHVRMITLALTLTTRRCTNCPLLQDQRSAPSPTLTRAKPTPTTGLQTHTCPRPPQSSSPSTCPPHARSWYPRAAAKDEGSQRADVAVRRRA